jgi:hypothetical protein
MKTSFSTSADYPEARSSFLGRLARIAFVYGSTISLSFAGYHDGDVRGSRSFAGPILRLGFTASNSNVAAGYPYLGRTMGYPQYRGPLVAPNRESVGSGNVFVPSPASQTGTTRRQEVVAQPRDPDPHAAVGPFGVATQGAPRDSAEIDAHRSKIMSQHLSANPAASEARARINEKFQRYENNSASNLRISGDRKESLSRARVFLLNLIDLGDAPLMVDSWCDDLLNDQIDDGMPMDLVDAYWGQPVDTQEFVEYYVPYEVCTYRTADGGYRQVTYKNRVVYR